MRGACVVQMEGILLHLHGDFGLGGAHSYGLDYNQQVNERASSMKEILGFL